MFNHFLVVKGWRLRGWWLEVKGWRLQVTGWRLEVKGWRLEVKGWWWVFVGGKLHQCRLMNHSLSRQGWLV